MPEDRKRERIRALKTLIKKYHPDLCTDEEDRRRRAEITVRLNRKLDQIRNAGASFSGNPSPRREQAPPPPCDCGVHRAQFRRVRQEDAAPEKNGSLKVLPEQDYAYYRLGISFYRNIHPDQFYRRNPVTQAPFEPVRFDEQLKALDRIFASFRFARHYFRRVIDDYPSSVWKNDAEKKLELLDRLQKPYEEKAESLRRFMEYQDPFSGKKN